MTPNCRGTDEATITANDRVVLDFVRKAAHPMSAYDILDLMRPDRPRIAPPTVYRSLARLAGLGLVHRVETLNAWFAPAMASPQGSGIITICDDCGDVGEYPAPEALSAIAGALGASGFHAQRPVVEVHGLCGQCDSKAST